MDSSDVLSDITWSERDKLGYGATSRVYKGYWRGNQVAVKIVERFEQEASLFNFLKHRNVIQFYGVIDEPDEKCIVTELAVNGSLYDYLRHRPSTAQYACDIEQILSWARDIARGMRYLHCEAPNAPIVHRDLKSNNVVIDEKMVCKLCDFGTSRTAKETTAMTNLRGTYAWMSPEMIKSDRISLYTDMWSFGVVLWEMLTLEIPFEGLDGWRIMWAVAENGLRLKIPDSCPEQLAKLMTDCWNVNPHDRPSFTEILHRLDFMVASPRLLEKSLQFLQDKTNWVSEIHQHIEEVARRLRSKDAEIKARELELSQKEERLRAVEASRTPSTPPSVNRAPSLDLTRWSYDEVANWIASIDSVTPEIAGYFRSHHIDGTQLGRLATTPCFLKFLGIDSLGMQDRITMAVRKLVEENQRLIDFPPLDADGQMSRPQQNYLQQTRQPNRQEDSRVIVRIISGMYVLRGGSRDSSFGGQANVTSYWKAFIDLADFDYLLDNALAANRPDDIYALVDGVTFIQLNEPHSIWRVSGPSFPLVVPDWMVFNCPPGTEECCAHTPELKVVVNFSSALVLSPRNCTYVLRFSDHTDGLLTVKSVALDIVPPRSKKKKHRRQRVLPSASSSTLNTLDETFDSRATTPVPVVMRKNRSSFAGIVDLGSLPSTPQSAAPTFALLEKKEEGGDVNFALDEVNGGDVNFALDEGGDVNFALEERGDVNFALEEDKVHESDEDANVMDNNSIHTPVIRAIHTSGIHALRCFIEKKDEATGEVQRIPWSSEWTAVEDDDETLLNGLEQHDEDEPTRDVSSSRPSSCKRRNANAPSDTSLRVHGGNQKLLWRKRKDSL